MKLLRHQDPRRAEAWIMAGLVDPQEPVRLAAMRVSADLKLAPAVPSLALAITTGTFTESMEALEALATISPEGRLITEHAITSKNRRLAAGAAEALSSARLDRAEAMV
jgi:HEAT repeat protein